VSTAGRSQQSTNVKNALNNVSTGQGLEGQAQNLASSEMNLNGGLSPLVGKQLANEQGQISKAYTSAAQGNERGLAQRGMSAAPSGMNASLMNSATNNAGQAQTGAIGNAFSAQNSLNNQALNPAINALGATTGAIGASTNANTALSQMPSTMSNVMSGLSGLSGIAGNVFGAGGIMGKGSSGGAFGGN
jgi:hypothetical protein